jgi:hypothetical protein
MRRGGLITLVVACCIAVTGDAMAADKKVSSERPPDWVQNYGRHNKECLEWTDGCINCARDGLHGDFSCSNIGPACQPKAVECLKRSGEKPE